MKGKIILTFLFLLCAIKINAQIIQFDGFNCNTTNNGDEWGVPDVVDGNDTSTGTADIINFWYDNDHQYLYLAFDREATGNSSFSFFINTDCNNSTGDPTKNGADLAAFFSISPGSNPTITDNFIYKWNGSQFVQSTTTFDAKLGNINCVNTNLGLFFELRIKLTDIFNTCDATTNCNKLTIEVGSSLAGGSPNSALKDTFVVPFLIGINSTPKACFTTNGGLCKNNSISFDASCSTFFNSDVYNNTNYPDTDDFITSYLWDFSYDGVTFNNEGSGISINHIFTTGGSHVVALKVTDNYGCTHITTKTITILEAPLADFTYSFGSCPYNVNFNGSLSVDNTPPNNLIYEWDFNYNGSTFNSMASGITPNYSYSNCGNYTVALRVTDPNTAIPCNQIIKTRIVSVQDSTPPTITILASNMTVACDGLGNSNALNTWLNSNAGAVATDNCGIVTWSNNYTSFPTSCGKAGDVNVIFTATDKCGNSSTTSATFTIEDKTAPSIAIQAANQTVECDGQGNQAALAAWLASNGGASASDACSNVTWSNNYTALSEDCGASGSATVTFTATDDCGNSSTTSATFTIEDKTAPSIAIQAANQTVECDGQGNQAALAAWLASNGGASASDACSNVTWSNNYTALSEDCGASGSATVTFTATTDDCGNSSTTSATFTIEDKTAPSIAIQAANQTVECDGQGNQAALAAWLASNGGASASDACSNVTWSNNYTTLSEDCGASGSATVTFTATDDCGNSSTTSATFTIEDKTAPSIAIQAANQTVECDGQGNQAALAAWLASNGGASASDACSNVTWSNNYTALSEDCGASGSATVTFTATDDCGNSSTTSATFTIEDKTAPSIAIQAANQTVECDGQGNQAALAAWLASNGGASASDACSNVTWSNNYTALSEDCGASGSATVTFTATDDCGNQSTTSATFTIEDKTAPSIAIQAANQTVECDGQGNQAALAAWLASNGGASASDACSNVTWSNNYTALSEDCGASGSATVTFTATDDCGNSSTTSATFTIEDKTAPSIAIQAANQTVECDGQGNQAALAAWLASNGGASASDACSNVTWSNNYTALSEDCGASGSATVTFTATDDCGNSSTTSATFTIEDKTAPSIAIQAANQTVECDGQGNQAALAAWLASNGGASASDACSNVTWSNNYTALSEDCGASGSATVTFTATDDCGNSSTTSATFTIEDKTAPSIAIQAANQTVECDGQGNQAALAAWLASNGGASASDACSNVTWSNNYTALSEDCGASGSATVTFTATDDCGNQSTTSATFTIEDKTAPSIAIQAANQTVECDGQGNQAALAAWLASNGGASASDACSNVTWSNNYTALSEDCGASGSATVTFTATDDCGNSSTTSATFTIEDKTAPSIAIQAANQTVECDGQGNQAALAAWLASNGGASASDACSNVTWSNNYTALSEDCGASGSATVIFTATDDCGNSSTTSATFTIEDKTAPSIAIQAANQTVECDGQGNQAALAAWLASNGGASASDACSNVTWSNNYTALSEDCGASGSATVTFTATDDCGNSSTTSATFTIEDKTAPSIAIQAANQTVECDGQGNQAALAAWLASNGGASASDACSNVTWSNNYTALSEDCGASGSATVTFTATDDCGNSSTTSATFTIEDKTAPSIAIQAANQTVECDGQGNQAALAAWLASNGGASASDACSNVTWSNNYTALSEDCGASGSATVTFTATDDCGNSSTTSATFTIEDKTAPSIAIQAANQTVECDGQGNQAALAAWLASNGGASASDACSNVTWSNNYTALSEDCGASGSATVTFTAIDDCGNSSTTSATFTIEDKTAPSIAIQAANQTVECDGQGNQAALAAWLASNGGASASDACSNVTWSNNYTALSEDCGASGSATVTFTATDDCGNSSTTSATFTIEDKTAPSIAIQAANQTVECDGQGNQAALAAWLASNGGASASDACSNVTWSNNYTALSEDCGASGSATVTFTATDDCGNSSTTSATFTIEDKTAPSIAIQAANQTVECDGQGNQAALAAWLASNGGASASDACSNVTWSNNYTALSEDCGASGSATVIFTATDDCGNSSTTSATFTIEDKTAPSIAIQAANQTVECDGQGNQAALAAWLASNGGASASDACSNVTWSNNYTALSEDCGASGSATVTFTATDDCGNSSTTSATFTIEDKKAPSIAIQAANQTVECDGQGNQAALAAWLASNGGASASDACSNVTWSNNYTALSEDCGASGSATVTFTATDDCGNSSTTSATFTIEDKTAPSIAIQAANQTVECDGQGNQAALAAWLASNGGASASDACSNVTWSNNYTALSEDCGASGSATVTFTATDDCGNSSTTSATFTIEDKTAPSIAIQAANQTVECDGQGNQAALAAWLASNGGASASDACSNVTWSNNYTALSEDCGASGSATVTFTATDDCGNQSTTSATFTIEDKTAPSIAIQAANQTVECDGQGNQAALAAWLASNGGASASDACSNVTWSNNYTVLSEDCGTSGSATVTFTATDDCGNQSTTSATFTIEDKTAPSIAIQAANQTVECDGQGNQAALAAWLASNGGASASDACSNVTWSNNYTALSEDCGASGSATVTFTAIDDCGNSSTTSATFTIEDKTAPSIAIQAANQTVECDGQGNQAALAAWLASNGGASASDACSNVTWSNNYTALSEDCGASGSATVTFTATDDCGNSSTTSATFTIEDKTAPSIAIQAANQTVECDGQGNVEALNQWLLTHAGATAIDNCSSDIVWTNNYHTIYDDCGATGTITVTFTAMDDCGNKTNTDATFTIQDTIKPVFSNEAPSDITVECDNIPVPIQLQASDLCQGNIDVVFNEIIENKDNECGSNYTIKRIWTAIDCKGNKNEYFQTITVQDTTKPKFTIELPKDIITECNEIPDVPTITASDNCDNNVKVNFVEKRIQNEENCNSQYTLERTWTAIDCSGNSTLYKQLIQVQDTKAPILVTPISENIDAKCNEIPLKPELKFEDNCSNSIHIDYSENISNQNDYGYVITREWIATDECGNATIIKQIINVSIGAYSNVISSLCIKEAAIDLFSLLEPTIEKDGIWLDVNNSGGLNGSQFDPKNVTPGFYVLRYTIKEGTCPRIIEIHMSVVDDCVVLPCSITDLNISKVVTPGSDGQNDFFRIGGLESCGFAYEVKIFNRWGNLVYENENYQNDWSGEAKGAISGDNLPSGTYYYIVNILRSGFGIFNGYFYLGTKN
ncbi:gliding motility-associated C-terminal domain-containing protein [Flavobacterium sp.]|uniref:HYR-like domain-containing protein n=1 Tax=Flavobacterium sp. TaxID=239 RepID=UPI003D0C692C